MPKVLDPLVFQDATSQNSTAQVLSAKGDILAGGTSGALTRHAAAGGDGREVVSDSSQSTGLRWEQRYVEAGFVVDGTVYLTFPYAVTLDSPASKPGTATLAYAKAVSASPTSFSTVSSWPTSFAVGDTLRLTATGVATRENVYLVRTA